LKLLTDEKENVIRALATGTKKIETCDAEIRDVKTILAKKQDELESIQGKLEGTNNVLAGMSQQIDNFREQQQQDLADAKAAAVTAQKELTKALTTGIASNEALDALRKEDKIAKANLEDERTQTEEAKRVQDTKTKEEQDRWEDERKRLTKDKAHAEAAVKNMRVGIATLQENRNTALAENKVLKKRLRVIQRESVNLQAIIRELRVGITAHIDGLRKARTDFMNVLGPGAPAAKNNMNFGKAWATYERIHRPDYVRNAVAAFGKSLRKKR